MPEHDCLSSNVTAAEFLTHMAELSGLPILRRLGAVLVRLLLAQELVRVIRMGHQFWHRRRSRILHQAGVLFRIRDRDFAVRRRSPCRILSGRYFRFYMPDRASSL